MSKYRKMTTAYTSRQHMREALKAAARELGIEFVECKPGQEEHLVGYHGDTREETATFIVRRKYIGSSSNDLGYHWDGKCYQEIVSEFDETYSGTTAIRDAVRREYAVIATTAAAKAKGYKVERISQPGGAVQLRVVGRV
jgi:hypothetical protein